MMTSASWSRAGNMHTQFNLAMIWQDALYISDSGNGVGTHAYQAGHQA